MRLFAAVNAILRIELIEECVMARVGEFCAANVTRLVLKVVIMVGLVLGVGVWLFYYPPHAPVIKLAPQKSAPAK